MTSLPATSPVTRLVWNAVPPLEQPPTTDTQTNRLHGRRIVVVGGDQEMSAQVVQELSARGCEVRAIDVRDDPEAEATVLRDLGEVDAIVDLNVGGADPSSDISCWEAPLLQSVRLLKACYARWMEETDAQRHGYLVVTRMGGHMGYHGGRIAQPLGGLWAGLAKTLPQELPNCNVKIVDLAQTDARDAGGIVARELYDWGLFEVGWIDGVRHVLTAAAERPLIDLADLNASDTVLLSGGARGIGYNLACHLASRGCRVIVTGRASLPVEGERWLELDDNGFRGYEWDALRTAARTRTVGAMRRRLDHERTLRAIVRNLREASARGLRLEYRQCDVTSPEQVTELVSSFAGALTVVVHNAGVDAPVRLPAKQPAVFLSTVRTKVIGFFNLLHAVRGVPVRMFCNVGSLTGRWGGMTGETDYAAANECLTRLGMWANARERFPVKTICWPTWDRVGMIKNFEVTGSYMSPLDVDEGVRHWHAELRSSGPPEVTYIGRVGSAVTPVQLNGFPAIAGMPGIEVLASRRHYLGHVRAFRPFHSLRTECIVSAASAPLLNDFRVDGDAAIPVSALLEYAISGGQWIQPAGAPPLHLHEIRDVDCQLRSLRLRDGVYRFGRDVHGSGSGDEWIVKVSIDSGGAEPAMRVTLVYRGATRPESQLSPLAPSRIRRAATSPLLHWRGSVFTIAAAMREPGGTWRAAVRPFAPADGWATIVPPVAILPANHIENALGAAVAACAEPGGDILTIARMRLFAAGNAHSVIGDPEAGTWHIVDDRGRAAIVINGLEFRIGVERQQVPSRG